MLLTTLADEATLMERAGRIRLDRVYRCVVPFRLERVPTGARVTGCGMNLDRYGLPRATLSLAVGGSRMTLHAGRLDPDWPGGGESRQVNGRQVEFQRGDDTVARSTVGDWSLIVATPRADLLDHVLSVAGWWQPVGVVDPATWTATPLS